MYHPEVAPKAKRRQFSAEYKLRILREAEACHEAGQVAALLRREGLYSSHLADWQQQRESGELAGLQPRQRGRRNEQHPLAVELAQVRQENERLQLRLQQAALIIEVQKNSHNCLG